RHERLSSVVDAGEGIGNEQVVSFSHRWCAHGFVRSSVHVDDPQRLVPVYQVLVRSGNAPLGVTSAFGGEGVTSLSGADYATGAHKGGTGEVFDGWLLERPV